MRQALSDAIDRSALIESTLNGYGTALTGPIPPSLLSEIAGTSIQNPTSTPATTTDPALIARSELLQKGWAPGPDGTLQKSVGSGNKAKEVELAFTLSTSNVPELQAVASSLAKSWTAMGAKVTTQIYDQGDLTDNVIRPRKFDALLFGEIVGRGLDLFAFWDSSQRNDPGLNIAMYANTSVDTILSKLRAGTDATTSQQLYLQFEAAIAKDNPAVFLYSPDFLYVVPADLKGISLGPIENPSDRFNTVQDWYRQTDHVWTIFAPSPITH